MNIVFNVLIQAFRLDIFDLYYLGGNESLKFLENNPAILPRKGIFVRMGAYVVHFFQEFRRSLLVKKIPEGATLFFVSTRNQRDSVSSLASSVRQAVVVGEKCELVYYFPLFWAYLLALPFLPWLCWRYLNAGEYHRKTFSYFADIYLLTYGYYLVGSFWLRKLKPTCLVTANDHNMQNRLMTNIVAEIGVPSVYLQHASVTDKFPPLNFDYSLLDGEDALQKYIKKGERKTTVYLIGIPKADAYAEAVNVSPSVKRLGVCCNMLDDEIAIENLCREIVTRFPDLIVFLRPHPSDKRRFLLWRKMAAALEMEYSNPLKESAFTFLGKIDAVIAGESNIHLEATLLDVYPLYYDFTGKALDWYGFMKNGVIEYHADSEALCQKISCLLQEKPSVRHRSKFYCHTVGTSYEWKSSQLARELIERIAAGVRVDGTPWRLLSGTKMRVFQIN